MPFVQQAAKELKEGSEWSELYDYFRDMSKAAGAKKPNGTKSEGPLEG